MLSPGDINTKKFEKSAFGYRIDDVDQYLSMVAEEYAKILHENDELEKKIVVLADKLEEYRQQESSLSAALLGAQKMGDKLISDAKEQVANIIGEANARAAKIIENAQREVSRERTELIRVQREIAAFKSKLLAMYTSQMDMIRALPDADRPRNEQPEPAQPQEKPAKFVYSDVQEVEDVHPIDHPERMPERMKFEDSPEPAFAEPTRQAEPQPEPPKFTQPEQPPKFAQPEPQRPTTAPKGFVPNLADDEIAESSYHTPPVAPAKTKKPMMGIDIPFEKDAADDIPLAADQPSSKFGELKFGAGYDLTRDSGFGMGKRKKR